MKNVPASCQQLSPEWRERMLTSHPPFQIGKWLVHSPQNQIEHNHINKKIGRKAMELLVFLSSRAGQVVDKQEIINEVWESRFVSDMVVTVTVSHLRRALEDNARAPEYLKTINGVGYKFLVAPTFLALERQHASCEPSRKHQMLPIFRLKYSWIWLFMVIFAFLPKGYESKSRLKTASFLVPNQVSVMEKITLLDLSNGNDGYYFKQVLIEEIKSYLSSSHIIENAASRSRKTKPFLVDQPIRIEGALLSSHPHWNWKLKVSHAETGQTIWLCETTASPCEIGLLLADMSP